jgi:hypothetical protein
VVWLASRGDVAKEVLNVLVGRSLAKATTDTKCLEYALQLR